MGIGNVPSWVYQREMSAMKTAQYLDDEREQKQRLDDLNRLLDVIGFSFIAKWCERHGYYQPIRKDWERLDKIAQLEDQIAKIKKEIEYRPWEYRLSSSDSSSLETLVKTIKDKEDFAKDNPNNKYCQTVYKTAKTRLTNLQNKQQELDVQWEKFLIAKTKEIELLEQQIDDLKNYRDLG